IAETGKVPVDVDWRRLERGSVNQGYVVTTAAGQCQGYSGDEVGPLAGLIVSIGQKVSLRSTEVHPHCQRMARMPGADAAQAPAAHDLSQCPRIVQVILAWAKGEFIYRVRGEVVANVEDAGPLVTGQAVPVFRSVGFTAADRPIVDGMRPRVSRLER